MACAAASAVLVVAATLGAGRGIARVLSLGVLAATFAAAAGRWWWLQTLSAVAAAIERRHPTWDNLLITAEEVLRGRHPALGTSLRAQIVERVAGRIASDRSRFVLGRVPLRAWLGAAGAVAAWAALTVTFPHAGPGLVSEPAVSSSLIAGDLEVLVTPPTYTRRPPVAFVNPTEVTAIEGSSIQLSTTTSATAWHREIDGHHVRFQPAGPRAMVTLTASTTKAVVVAFGADPEAPNPPTRVMVLHVLPDKPPLVRVQAPAEDLLFAEPRGRVAVAISVQDDVAVESIALRYTRVSGSGEGLAFQEGTLPLIAETAVEGESTGRAIIDLSALRLSDGDSLVYRATARDGRPGSEEASSDSYVIEIGRVAAASSTGFALPEDVERQGISQQLLIVKTERLHADRASLARADVVEQARMLAIEQRMVRAEFVFMTGGEVEDEVEEATHAHELMEGRLENQGQAELLAAIREMSRAEARLNAGDTAAALVFERAALRALQRAFDRRRYLLRTIPERARIDVSRRLSGDWGQARPARPSPAQAAADPRLVRARLALALIGAYAGSGTRGQTELAAAVIEVDPTSDALRVAAGRLAASTTQVELQNALEGTQRELRRVLSRGSTEADAVPRLARDVLQGRVRDERARSKDQ